MCHLDIYKTSSVFFKKQTNLTDRCSTRPNAELCLVTGSETELELCEDISEKLVSFP